MESTEAVQRALDPAQRDAFDHRVDREAASLQAAIRRGEFDAPTFAVGLELEGYVVDADGRLAAAPEALFETEGCSRELGVHNAELHTYPDVPSGTGFARQAADLRSTHQRVTDVLEQTDRRFIFDAMWTVPPASGTRTYLERGSAVDGVFICDAMRPVPRYVAIDQVIRERNDGEIPLDLPAFASTNSMLVESLATSMQPHLQLPDPTAIPQYLNVATRTMGPILSLSANSPFLPADLYAEAVEDDADTFEDLVDATPHELRIPIFERSVDEGSNKCRVPRDVETIDELIDRMRTDPTLVAPTDLGEGADEDGEANDDYAALAAKRSTYWRWVRPVFGGDVPRTAEGESPQSGSQRSVRIEYRPLPTQPTRRDTIGLQAFVVGVLRGVDATDHPLATLPWEDAESSFYAAVDDGPDATLQWVTRDGTQTSETAVIYDELFTLARAGLTEFGVEAETIEWVLEPIEARRDATHTAPSAWKRARVRDQLAAGASPAAAIREMQTAYIERAASDTPFAHW